MVVVICSEGQRGKGLVVNEQTKNVIGRITYTSQGVTPELNVKRLLINYNS